MIDEPEPVGRPGDNMALLRTLLIPTNNRVRDPVVGVRTYARPRLNPAGFVNLIHILVFASYGYRPSPAFIKFSSGQSLPAAGRQERQQLEAVTIDELAFDPHRIAAPQ